MFEYKGLQIKWYGHDTFSLEGDIKIYTDPYKISKKSEADLILISHDHFDHLSLEDLKKISTNKTTIVTAREAAQATETIKPKIAIPMHYGTIVGSENDATEFKNLVKSCEVQILTKE